MAHEGLQKGRYLVLFHGGGLPWPQRRSPRLHPRSPRRPHPPTRARVRPRPRLRRRRVASSARALPISRQCRRNLFHLVVGAVVQLDGGVILRDGVRARSGGSASLSPPSQQVRSWRMSGTFADTRCHSSASSSKSENVIHAPMFDRMVIRSSGQRQQHCQRDGIICHTKRRVQMV